MKTNKTSAILAVAASIAAMVSCQKEETSVPAQQEGISTITLTIEQPSDEDATRTVLGTETSGFYPINWSENDSIAVSSQSGSTYEKYKLTEGKGSPTGSFTGTAVSGAVYAYYPYSGVKSVSSGTYTVTIPDRQTYAAGSFGEGALPMYGIAGSTGDLHTLKPLMSVLKLPLKGTCKVKRIVVSSETQKLSGTGTVTFDGTTASLTVTGNDFVELICPDVQLSSEATLFHIAIPASSAGEYTVRVITDESKVLSKTLTVSAAFTAGKMKKTNELGDIAPTEVKYVEGSYCGTPISITAGTMTVVWAPVNCGYDADHLCGKLYQWGRMDGSGYYKDGSTNPASDASDKVIQTNVVDLNQGTYTTSNPAADTFYKNPNTGTNDWYTSSKSAQFSSWPMTAPSNTSRIGNPCPAGWRVPTSDELGNMVYSDWNAGTQTGSTNRTYTLSSGYGTINGLTLPAAGVRNNSNGSSGNRGSFGYYWSSAVNGDKARIMSFGVSSALMNSRSRGYGYSVRCVQE